MCLSPDIHPTRKTNDIFYARLPLMSQYTASCHQHAVMFADVSGSSALYKLVGNEKAKAIIDETIYFMVTLTAEHQGTVVNYWR